MANNCDKVNRYLKMVKEEAFGTTPGSPDWKYLDISSTDISGPDGQADMYESVGARAPRLHAPGIYTLSGDFSIPVDVVNIGQILMGVFGCKETDEDTPSAGKNTHTFTPTTKIRNGLPSYTLAVGKDDFEHRFKGIVFEELSLELDNKFLIAGVSCVGKKDSKEALQEVDMSEFPAEILYAMHANFLRGDPGATLSDISAKIEDFNLNISNDVDIESGIPANSRFPERFFLQGLEVSVDLTLVFEDEDELEAFWGNASGPTEDDKITEKELSFQFVEKEDEKELEINIPKAVMQSHSAPIDTRGRIEQTVSYTAVTDDDDERAVEAKLINDKGGDEY